MERVNESAVKRIVRIVAALAMISIGLVHFVSPEGFEKIVPAYLPAPKALVLISGFFEILGGAGLLIPRVRRAASFGLIALYVCVFPANINMAIHDIQPTGHPIPTALLWLRLPFQILFIAVAWWVGRDSRATPDGKP